MVFNGKILGVFEFYVQDQKLVLENNRPTKVNLLMQYLFYCGSEGVNKNKLLSILYDDDAIDNPENNLKVNVHRLRKIIKDNTGVDDLIVVSKSVYRLNPTYLGDTDYHTFLREYELAEASESEVDKLNHYRKCVEVYDGELLPYFCANAEIAYVNIGLKEKYYKALFYMIEHLSTSAYDSCLLAISKAIGIYAYDEELYAIKLRLLIEAKNYHEAMRFYNDTSKFFIDNMGIEELPSLKAEYLKMDHETDNNFSDITTVRKQIEEEEMKDAYFCNYLSFIDNYHIVNRLMSRMGRSVFLLLCSFEEEKGYLTIEETGNSVHKAIAKSLRSGDIFTRYNANQFLLLLCNVQQENIEVVTKRVEAYLKKNTKVSIHNVHFTAISAFDRV